MANGIQKDLGKVTAYSYAKAAGYTGTEEQFQAIFNEFTENAPGLMDRMDTAVARAEAAVTNIDATVQDAVDDAVEEATASAVATANQAVTDAQAAQAAAEGAVTQANAAVTQANSAVSAAQAAQAAAEDAAESFVLDRTLTDSGAAAPADLVGNLKESTKDTTTAYAASNKILEAVQNTGTNYRYAFYKGCKYRFVGTNVYTAITLRKKFDTSSTGDVTVWDNSRNQDVTLTLADDFEGIRVWQNDAVSSSKAATVYMLWEMTDARTAIYDSEVKENLSERLATDFNSKLPQKYRKYYPLTISIGDVDSERGDRCHSQKINIDFDTVVTFNGTLFKCLYLKYLNGTRQGYSSWDNDGELTIPISDAKGYDIYLLFGLKNDTQINSYMTQIESGTIVSESAEITFKQLYDYDERITNLENAIPSQYDSYLPTKEAQIQNVQKPLYNYDSYIAITDLHWDYNTKNSPKLTADIRKKCNITNVFLLGDYIQQTTETEGIKYMEDIRDGFGFDHTYYLFGNHDLNEYSSGQQIAASVFYNIFEKMNENNISGGSTKNCDWYVDNQYQKIRYIALNSLSGTPKKASLEWLRDILTGTPQNYKVVLLIHIIEWNESQWANNASAIRICDRYAIKTSGEEYINSADGAFYLSYDFTNANGEMLYVHSGHWHTDRVKCTEHGIPVIFTRCDSNELDDDDTVTVTRIAGTTDEQAFDVATIDFDNDLAILNRVGYGANRFIHYNPNTLTAATTFTPSNVTSVTSWSSLDTSVATVDNGTVTPIATGSTVITAKNASGEEECWTVVV